MQAVTLNTTNLCADALLLPVPQAAARRQGGPRRAALQQQERLPAAQRRLTAAARGVLPRQRVPVRGHGTPAEGWSGVKLQPAQRVGLCFGELGELRRRHGTSSVVRSLVAAASIGSSAS